MRRDVRREMIRLAKERDTINYKPLRERFGLPFTSRDKTLRIGSIVGEISDYEFTHDRPLLSVIVVGANTRTNKLLKGHPGSGFWGLDGIPAHLRRPESRRTDKKLTPDEEKFIKEEQQKVWDHWATHDDDESELE